MALRSNFFICIGLQNIYRHINNSKKSDNALVLFANFVSRTKTIKQQ